MKASALALELNRLVEEKGDLEVDISIGTQSKEMKKIASDQGYLVSDPGFVVLETYENEPSRIMVRDWPY